MEQQDQELFSKIKFCNKCQKFLPATPEVFGNRKCWKDGLEYYCKVCSKKDRDRRHADPIKRATYSLASKKRNLLKKSWYHEFKKHPCVDCGVQLQPELMDFDHVRGKKINNVSRLVLNNSPKQTIIDEIAKCDLLCIFCHFTRTHYFYQAKADKVSDEYCSRATKRKRTDKREVDSLKSSQPCYVCNKNFPTHHLQWDHTDPNLKRENISKLINLRKSMEIVKKELENCRVICVACHRLKSLFEKEAVNIKTCLKCNKDKAISNFREFDGKNDMEYDICKLCLGKKYH